MKTKAILGLMLFAALIWVGCATDDESPTDSVGKSGTQISGELTGTLSAANSPYWVTDDLTVPAGENLTIEAGVELRFDGLYQFTVQGHLDAIGTAERNIVFTSMTGALGAGDYGQWRALIFDTGSDVSEMAFCRVQFGAVPDTSIRYPDENGRWLNAGVFIWECSPVIRNCTILMNGYHGVWILGTGSNPILLNNNIYENDGDGIRCESGATAQIRHTNCRENNTRQYADCPDGIGQNTRLNANRDSCDFQFNIKLDPAWADFDNQDYSILSTSHLIGAGLDTLGSGTTIGSMPYYMSPTELRGPIGGTVITAEDSPWYVTNDCFIEEGDVLVTEPGAVVLFTDIFDLRIAGLIQAEGTIFMPEDTNATFSRWDGITIVEEADDASYIKDCEFYKTSTTIKTPPYGGAITVISASPEISGNLFRDSELVAISCLNGAAPEIADNMIDGFGVTGIFTYNNSHPYIHHNIVTDGKGYGILVEANSSPTIETNIVYNTTFIGLKCLTNASPTIQYNTIVDHSYTGIEIEGQSNPIIRNNIVAFNGAEAYWNSGSTLGGIQVELPDDVDYSDFTLEFDAYRRIPSTDQQVSRVGISSSEWTPQDGFYLEVDDASTIAAGWNGSTGTAAAIGAFEARWQHVVMERSGGDWTITWDEGGANETVITGQDEFSTLTAPYLWVEGTPFVNTAHYDNFNLSVAGNPVFTDDFNDGNYTQNPTWTVALGVAEHTSIGGEDCLLVRGEDLYGNGIDVKDEFSSLPTVQYNDVYQPDGEGHPFGGISPDNTNILVDPRFVDMEGGNFHLQSGSPCLTAGSDGGEIGAYGKDGDW